MMRAGHLLAAVSILALPGSAQVATHEYPVVGMVLQVDPATQSFVVSHERIPDLMDGMTMRFMVRDRQELEGLVPGAIVSFTLVAADTGSYAAHVHVRRYESVEQDPLNAKRLGLLSRIGREGSAQPLLEAGQRVPDFTLTNQMNRPVSLSQFRGKVVALTFIYTSCALPNFCLRSANNLGALQKRFARVLGRDLMLLAISFDPLRDRPDVLARYADQWKAEASNWSFLTGEVPDVRRVCQLFGMDFFPNEGLVDHSLRTAIIGRDQTLVANIEGNQFSARQLGDLVESVMTPAPPRR